MRCARNSNPKLRAKATISGAITASDPEPATTITPVLSMMQTGQLPLIEASRLEQEVFCFKARKAGIVLKEQPARVGQGQAGTLGGDRLARQCHPMRRGVFLHLLARGLVVLAGTARRIAQLCVPDPPRQRAVGHLQSSLAGQQFLHAHPVPARTPEGLLELGQDSGIAGQRRRALASLLAQNAAHRITRQLQKPADLAQALALRPEKLYAVADLDRDHVGSTA